MARRNGPIVGARTAAARAAVALYEAVNARDTRGMRALFAQMCFWHDRTRGTLFGSAVEVIEGHFGRWWRSFSDIQVNDLEVAGSGDFATARYVLRGTHTEPIGTLGTTGRRIGLPVCDVLRVEDAIVEGESYYDATTLLRQLGQPVAPSLEDDLWLTVSPHTEIAGIIAP